MNNAKVESIEAVQRLADGLPAFRASLLKEIDNLEMELRRLSAWIGDDARRYWQQEHQTVARKFEEHSQQLSRCMSYVRDDDRRPCTEEKKRVARAKERILLCENKLRLVRAATTHWETEVTKLATKLAQCRNMADSALLVAIGHLRKILDELERYTSLRSARPQATVLQETEKNDQGPEECSE